MAEQILNMDMDAVIERMNAIVEQIRGILEQALVHAEGLLAAKAEAPYLQSEYHRPDYWEWLYLAAVRDFVALWATNVPLSLRQRLYGCGVVVSQFIGGWEVSYHHINDDASMRRDLMVVQGSVYRRVTSSRDYSNLQVSLSRTFNAIDRLLEGVQDIPHHPVENHVEFRNSIANELNRTRARLHRDADERHTRVRAEYERKRAEVAALAADIIANPTNYTCTDGTINMTYNIVRAERSTSYDGNESIKVYYRGTLYVMMNAAKYSCKVIDGHMTLTNGYHKITRKTPEA